MQKVRYNLFDFNSIIHVDFTRYFTDAIVSFSPFLRSTSSLLIVNSYLGLEGDSPIFKQSNMFCFT